MATTVFHQRVLQLRGGRLALDSDPSSTVTIGDEPIVIGRDPSCGFVVADSGVSAMHAELVATPRGVRLRDLGSKNGTWVGDLRIVDAYLGEATSFFVARTELQFEPTKLEKVDLPDLDHFGPLWGTSAPMLDLFRRLQKASETELTVLIQGETGVGKELVAQAIHEASPRRRGPFVVVDCGAIAPTLAEATLFGHEKGAFTGAATARQSPFLEANGGTLFLDELGELPMDVQPKLLRALAERRVKAVGSNTYQPFDARIVAATRRDLESAVNAGTFRSDLYFRLAQVRAHAPPLRQRLEDLPGLVRHMLDQMGQKAAWRRVSRATLDRLLRYDWPGNVRELRNAVAVALALGEEKEPLDLAGALGLKVSGAHGTRAANGPNPSNDANANANASASANPAATASRGYHDAKRDALQQFERAYFTQLDEATDGNVAEISRRTGLQRTHVRRYLRLHGLREPRE